MTKRILVGLGVAPSAGCGSSVAATLTADALAGAAWTTHVGGIFETTSTKAGEGNAPTALDEGAFISGDVIFERSHRAVPLDASVSGTAMTGS